MSLLNPLGLRGIPLLAAWLAPGIPPPGPFGNDSQKVMLALAQPTKLCASAYAHQGRMCISGLARTPSGVVPFTWSTRVSGDVPNGPIALEETSKQSPSVNQALAASSGPIQFGIETQQIRAGVENLVERARLGDQNAVAIIAKARENARQGEPRASMAVKAMRAYIEHNPPGHKMAVTRFGELFDAVTTLAGSVQTPEGFASATTAIVTAIPMDPDSHQTAATAIANGKPITNEMLTAASISSGSPQVFTAAYKSATDKAKRVALIGRVPESNIDALRMGFTIGTAKRLQDVRDPSTEITKFSPMAGWEHGEGPDNQ